MYNIDLLCIELYRSVLCEQRYSMTSKVMSNVKTSVESHQLEWWLYGSAAALATSLTVAATAPFTRAGASMLYYKPRSIFRPNTESQWQKEFEVYRDFFENNLDRPLVSFVAIYMQMLSLLPQSL